MNHIFSYMIYPIVLGGRKYVVLGNTTNKNTALNMPRGVVVVFASWGLGFLGQEICSSTVSFNVYLSSV